MTLVKIRLRTGEWQYDTTARLGPPGGFGEVFRGTGSVGPVAIKRLDLAVGDAAHREMKIGESLVGRSHEHVVPVIDYGQDADGEAYYLVMPICDRSLSDELKGGQLSWDHARPIVLQIIDGLLEVKDIVHRDLKPGNVLFHEGKWKIADFGIAKFVEDATSLLTLREALTPPFAAPEQWRGERPEHATDVYALGCIIHAMLTGSPPFVGTYEDIREGHLRREPPELPGVDPRLASIVRNMLRKSQEGRPDLARCRAVLEKTSVPLSGGLAALAIAGKAVSEERSRAEAAAAAAAAGSARYQLLTEEAAGELLRIKNRMFDMIEETADDVTRGNLTIELGNASISFAEPNPHVTPLKTMNGWTIVVSSSLTLTSRPQRKPGEIILPGPLQFATTLLFASTADDTNFRWTEIGFFGAAGQTIELEALPVFSNEFSMAMSRSFGPYDIAYGPRSIDAEDEEDFIDRWLRVFAKGASGTLKRPRSMPLPDSFFQ